MNEHRHISGRDENDLANGKKKKLRCCKRITMLDQKISEVTVVMYCMRIENSS